MKCFLTVLKKPLQSKLLLAMKLTALMICFFTLNVSANGFGQETISLRVKKAEISGVLRSIEKQTNYRFLYNDKLADIREKVSINVKEASIADVLTLVLDKTRLLFQVMENNLIVIKEDPNAPPRIPDVVIHGKVTGEGGLPLAGASVQVKGTTTGTTTNGDGIFSLSVTNANVTLVVSSVGYDPKEIALGGQTDITAALSLSTKIMDQVVVIGYGTASKRDLTGSIVKISGKDIQDKPNTNPIASLQSKVAGLYIVNSGTPGKEPDIRIRGTVSIGQVHPLYVVDGIFEDNINYINPNDIESVEIMKDPSSLAIFGVRGATGVIAITTKRAKAGQTTINFSTSYGVKTLVDKIKMANASEFSTLYAEENANNNVTTPDYSAFTSNTDWIDAVTRTGKFNNTSLSLSQSTDRNKFNLGVGYIHDEGIIQHEQLEKIIISFSDEVKISKAIKMGINLNGSRQHNPYDATWVLDDARKVQPQVSAGTKNFRVKNPYSSDSLNVDLYSALAIQGSGVENPLLRLNNTWDKTISYEYRYLGSAFIDINFLKNFNFRSTWYADISNLSIRTYSPLYYTYSPFDNKPFLYNTKTSVSEEDQNYRKFQQDYILTYKKSFGDHNLTATAGFTTFYFGTFQQSGTSTQGTAVTDLPIPNNPRLWYLNNGFGYILQNGATSYQSENTTVSGLARVLYNYKGKYFLNGSFRDDASSRIPEKNRHQQFWSIGGAWEISKEDFFQHQRYIDYLKLRVSTGVLGNQSTYLNTTLVSPDYLSYPGLVPGTVVPFGENLVNAALPAYAPNGDLRWETVNASDISVELNAFKNRLHFEASYYTKTTKDMMTFINLGTLGLDNKLENGGEIKNWGEEFSATWTQNINKDITININGNITFMKNKVLSVATDLPGGLIIEAKANNGTAEARTFPGYPIGSFFGYVVDGIYQSNLDILKSPSASSLGAYRPGDFKFKDVNGDGVIDSKDRTIIGDPSPDFIYGTSIGVTYKRFSVSMDIGGVYGNDIFRIWGSLESPFQRVNYPQIKTARWHGPGTSNWEPLLSSADRFNYNGSTYNIEDGSYVRIRNLQVGYDVNTKMIAKGVIKDLRIFVNAQNLKTWKHNNGYSPEYGGSATSFGFDEAGGALPRIITFGLNVTF
jgi:TonB-linked SusC/RagA family outer membrane protein